MIDPVTRRCPDVDQTQDTLIALLPRGRAWGARYDRRTVMARFFRACAHVLAELQARVCALREEFFCHSHVETNDWWLTEYGLPDACDPYPNVCSKVVADGTRRCEDWSAVAAASGWAMDCALRDACGGMADEMMADCGEAGESWRGPALILTVRLNDSPAYGGLATEPPAADCYAADEPVGCGPDIAPLQCLIDALIPDHIERVWRPIP